MLRVTMYEHSARITIHAKSREEFQKDRAKLRAIPKERRSYHDGIWIIKHPEDFREDIPAIDAALKDRDLQMTMF